MNNQVDEKPQKSNDYLSIGYWKLFKSLRISNGRFKKKSFPDQLTINYVAKVFTEKVFVKFKLNFMNKRILV